MNVIVVQLGRTEVNLLSFFPHLLFITDTLSHHLQVESRSYFASVLEPTIGAAATATSYARGPRLKVTTIQINGWQLVIGERNKAYERSCGEGL